MNHENEKTFEALSEGPVAEGPVAEGTAAPSRKCLVGLGEILWDVYDDKALFGGAPANFACHASSLGAESLIVGAVGRDQLGTQAMQWMREHDLSLAMVGVDDAHPTGTVRVSLDATGKPEYVFAADVAWDHLICDRRWLDAAAKCDAVCFGSLAQRSSMSRDAITRFVSATREDCLRVFDVNLRQNFFNAEILERSLGLSQIAKLNDEELPRICDLLRVELTDEVETITRLADRYSLRCVALTRGAKGSVVWLDGELDVQEPISVQAIDTVGAGDAFSAALIMGILNRVPLSESHRRAALVAAYVCTQRGAVPPLPQGLF